MPAFPLRSETDALDWRVQMPSRLRQLPTIYRLKLWLREIEPPIWRRLEVPADITLPRLHRVIQIAIGWEDYHLHLFEIGRHRYEVPDPEDLYKSKSIDERRVRLDRVVEQVGTEWSYLYDFGDGWGHGLLLEAIVLPEPGVHYPRCTAGALSGPPEDTGGPYSYKEYLEALADPRHERHEELLAWRGPFDPERFNLKAINRELAATFRRPTKPSDLTKSQD